MNFRLKMARGHQKLQSQAKTQEKTAKAKKQQGHSATEQKKAAQKALVHACAICKVGNAKQLQKIYFYFKNFSFLIARLKCPIRKHINNISRTSILKVNYRLN